MRIYHIQETPFRLVTRPSSLD